MHDDSAYVFVIHGNHTLNFRLSDQSIRQSSVLNPLYNPSINCQFTVRIEEKNSKIEKFL